jgi:hypothetical protein
MTASSRLGTQLKVIVSTLGSAGAPFALIGGLALAPHKVIRATQDIGLLMDATMADRIHDALVGLGYRCLHRSVDAANRESLDMDEAREYFRLFGKETLLEAFLG